MELIQPTCLLWRTRQTHTVATPEYYSLSNYHLLVALPDTELRHCSLPASLQTKLLDRKKMNRGLIFFSGVTSVLVSSFHSETLLIASLFSRISGWMIPFWFVIVLFWSFGWVWCVTVKVLSIVDILLCRFELHIYGEKQVVLQQLILFFIHR